MDRLTHAEVGGPYSSREDAERAIRAGSFDQDAAELAVMESESGDVGSRAAAFDGGGAPVTDPSPTEGEPDTPELPDPMPQQQVMPKTTKPAQTPGGSGGLPQDPMSPQFDPAPMNTPGPDPLASATASVVTEIRAANPGMDGETLIRVASRTVARLLEADFDPSGMRPHIEDPLHNRTPWQLLNDVRRTVPHRERREDGQQRRSPMRRAEDWAERRLQERRPDLFFGEEDNGQGTLFPEPERQQPRSRPEPEQGSEPERERPMPGQQTLFDDPDEVQDPPAPPAPRRRTRPVRPLPGEFDPPEPPDLSRFDQPGDPPPPSGPQQQALFDLPADPQAARQLPMLLT